MKKCVPLLLSLALILSVFPLSAQADNGRFSDTAGHWAEAAIDRWSDYGVIQGSDGLFDPNGQLTRAQIATILSNTLGLTEQTAQNPFGDLDPNQWYAAAILRCHAAGLMQGDGVNVHPDDILTRQEAMVLLSRALDIAPVTQYDLSSFQDSGEVDDWAAPYVCAMTNTGIVNGVYPGVLSPKGNMTRASLMTVLDRSIVQYINHAGNYTFSAQDGIILVVTGDVNLSGATPANVLVTKGANRKNLTFNGAKVTGSITVQGDGVQVTAQGSTLPGIRFTGRDSRVVPSTPAPTPTPKPTELEGQDLTIGEKKDALYEDETYRNVTVTSSLRNTNSVTLENLTINGDLIIRGGCGSKSKPLTLTNCTVKGKILIDKSSSSNAYIVLNKTPLPLIEINSPLLVEAKDKNCVIQEITTQSDVTLTGSHTSVKNLQITEDKVKVVVEDDATLSALETAEETRSITVQGSVKEITARGNLSFSGVCDVDQLTIPSTVSSSKTLTIDLSADTTISILTVETTTKISVQGDEGAVIEDMDFVKKHKVSVSDNISDEPHTWSSSWSTNDSSHWHKCKDKNCSATRDKASHSFNSSGKCTVCGYVQLHTHKWSAWKSVSSTTHERTCSAANCTIKNAKETGSHDTKGKDGACSVCGYKASPSTHSHTWSTSGTKKDDSLHTLSCTVKDCKETKTEAHNTIGTDGACSVCGFKKDTSTPGTHEHTWDSGTVTEEATCGKEGEKTFTCTVSGCTETKTEKIPATGKHTWDDGKETKAPTATEAGETTYTCTECGETKTEEIPATGDSGEGGDSGETGGETGGETPES